MAFPLRQSPGVGPQKLTKCWTILFACSATPGSHTLSCIWVPQENGIFDAIEKQYLRSFIFAIYLVRVKKTFASMSCQCKLFKDPEDPNKYVAWIRYILFVSTYDIH